MGCFLFHLHLGSSSSSGLLPAYPNPPVPACLAALATLLDRSNGVGPRADRMVVFGLKCVLRDGATKRAGLRCSASSLWMPRDRRSFVTAGPEPIICNPSFPGFPHGFQVALVFFFSGLLSLLNCGLGNCLWQPVLLAVVRAGRQWHDGVFLISR